MVPPPPREYCGFSRRLVGLKEISPVERRAYVDCEGTNLCMAWIGQSNVRLGTRIFYHRYNLCCRGLRGGRSSLVDSYSRRFIMRNQINGVSYLTYTILQALVFTYDEFQTLFF